MTAGHDEFALINSLASLLDHPTHGIGIGDDASTWPPTPGTMTVATTNTLSDACTLGGDGAGSDSYLNRVGWRWGRERRASESGGVAMGPEAKRI